MKKIISVLTAALIMALCFCPLCALAADEPEIAVKSSSAAQGELAKVDIVLNNNPGIISAKLKVEFDDALKLSDAAFGGELGGTTKTSPDLKSPFILNWLILETSPSNMDKDTIFATLTFDTSGAKPGEYAISVSYNPDDVYNASEANIAFKTVAGSLTVLPPAAGADTVTTGYLEEDGEYTGGEEIIDPDYVPQTTAAQDADELDRGKILVFVWIGITAAIIIAAIITVLVIKKKKKENMLD